MRVTVLIKGNKGIDQWGEGIDQGGKRDGSRGVNRLIKES